LLAGDDPEHLRKLGMSQEEHPWSGPRAIQTPPDLGFCNRDQVLWIRALLLDIPAEPVALLIELPGACHSGIALGDCLKQGLNHLILSLSSATIPDRVFQDPAILDQNKSGRKLVRQTIIS